MVDRPPIKAGKYLQKKINALEEIPFTLSSIANYAIENAVHCYFRKNDQLAFFEMFALAHLSSTWHWKAMFDDGPHRIHLPGREPFEIGRVKPNVSVSYYSWLRGIYLGMILRDIDAVRVYATADLDWTLKYTQLRVEPWQKPFFHFLNGIWNFDEQISVHLKNALEGTDPKYYDEFRGEGILNLESPLLELWATVFSSHDDRFNEALFEQQKLRHDWYVRKDEDSYNSIMEYIDLAALAAVCYAHDKGMKIEVQSEYLPEFLIRGQFPKVRWPNPEWDEGDLDFS